MFRIKYLIAAALWLCQTAAFVPAQTAFPELQKLYAQKKYFELRQEIRRFDHMQRPELLFFRGAIDNIFNRLPSSIHKLLGYLEAAGDSGPAERTRKCLELLADSYRKSFQYSKAADMNEKILILYREVLEPEEKEDITNEFRLWNALKDVSPQTAEFGGNTHIQLEGSHVPLQINGNPIALTYDTGADLSVLIQSLAQKFSLDMVDVPIQVGTITGEKIEAKVGVASESKIGNMTIHGALFLVVNDEDFYIPEARLQIKGVIGFPVLAAMQELTITRANDLIIPSTPHSKGEPNLALEGFKPLIEAHYLGHRLAFVLDTGANRSDLWPPFLKAFGNEFRKTAPLQTEKFRGAGSQREVKAYILRDLPLLVSGREAVFRRIPVFAEYTTENSYFFYGNLGQDLVRQFQRMTINFVSMRITFE
jgi:hypothetical protein